jgi:hypothetical protein
MTVSNELLTYKSDLVEIHVVRLDRRGTEPAGEYAFFWER